MAATRRDFLGAMMAIPCLAVTGAAEPSRPVTPRSPYANGEAAQRRRLGVAVRPDQLGTARLGSVIARDCGILVPEYHGQWSAVEWRRGDPWFGNYDALTAYAAATGKQVRGHALIWEQMTPDWAREEMLAEHDWRTVENHFATLLPRYRGAVDEWIVVNEMIDTVKGDRGFRRTSFQRAYGNDYVERALRSAHAFDPGARLMINDFALEHANPVDAARRDALLRLVERLKGRGVPLDVVGLQGHIELAKGPVDQPALRSLMADLAAMGVELAITELDVLEAERGAPTARRDALVADAVESLLDVALDQPAMTSVVTWGLSDSDSWLQDRAAGTQAAQRCTPVDCLGLNRGLPYDGEMATKPMRDLLARVAA